VRSRAIFRFRYYWLPTSRPHAHGVSNELPTPGQQLLDHALSTVINYPVVSSLGIIDAISSLALVTAAAVVMVAAPGYFASRVPAALALQD
jgi:hypothetical protein